MSGAEIIDLLFVLGIEQQEKPVRLRLQNGMANSSAQS